MEELIVSDSKIMMGKPIIKGTRLTVEHILEELSTGMTQDQLLDAYPNLTPSGIQAALKFAAQSVRNELIYPVPSKK